jgi:hypothetical protein
MDDIIGNNGEAQFANGQSSRDLRVNSSAAGTRARAGRVCEADAASAALDQALLKLSYTKIYAPSWTVSTSSVWW